MLVVGNAPSQNSRVLVELETLGLTVTACDDLPQASNMYDAREFDVVAFGRATLGRIAYEQEQRFRNQNPSIRIVEAIGPLATRQVVGALRHDPRSPRFVATLDVEPTPERGILRAEVLAPCTLRLWVFRLASGALTTETLALVRAEPSIFTLSIPLDRMQGAYSFVADANEDELVHFPVLVPDARS